MSQAVDFRTYSANKRKFSAFSRSNFIEGTADDYANGGKRSKDANGSERGTGSSILARSRARGAGVTTPQCLVNLTSIVPKNEKLLRALACKGDPNDLYGKPATNEATLDVHKGQIVLHRAKVGSGFRTHASAESGIECISTMNGVSISGTRLFGVAVAQVECYPRVKESSNQTTTTWHGVQTIINYSDQRWNAGDLLIADPFPITVRSRGGESRPMVMGPEGIPDEAQNIILRPFGAAHLSHLVNQMQDLIRLKLGSGKIGESPVARLLQDAKTSEAMLAVLHSVCDNIFATEMVVAPDHPLRGYALAWAADRLLDMITVDWRGLLSARTKKPLTEEEYGNYMRIALLTKLRAVIDVEDKFVGATNAYAASLPHSGDHVDTMSSSDKARSALRSTYLMSLVSLNASITGDERRRCMLEFQTRVKMHMQHCLEEYYNRIRDYFGAFHAGMCLSSADKGSSADVFIGKTA